MNSTVTKHSSVTVRLKGHEITLTEDEAKELRDALNKLLPTANMSDVLKEIYRKQREETPYIPPSVRLGQIPHHPKPLEIYCQLP